jgi:hypothetical protein
MRKEGGRTKGATSFVTVSLGELNRVLKEEAVVVVSRKYADALSLKSQPFTAVPESYEAFISQVELSTSQLDSD